MTQENYPEQHSCPICHTDGVLVDTVPTINPTAKLQVKLLGCKRCGHWWHSPLPTQLQLNDFYKNSSEYVVPKNYARAIERTSNQDTTILNKIYRTSERHSEKIKRGNFNYLELGVGSGDLFNFFKKKAGAAYGIEPGDWVLGNKENIVGNIEDLPKNIRFDVIIAHDVLEHLHSPTNMLKQLANVASKECSINCTFPNKDSLKARIQKGRWHMIRPFGHLHYFSKDSIRKMFHDSGWVIAELRNVRIAEETALEIVKKFDYSSKKRIWRMIKSLLLGQLLLGKDQWVVIAKKK